MDNVEGTIVHKFEEAGLGKAPFTFEYAVWEDWSSCQYCAHEIKQKCYIKDVNGKLFFVGNECVNQTGDQGLIDTAKEKIRELKKKLRHEREQKQILTARMFLYGSQKLRKAYLKAEKSKIKYEIYLIEFIRDKMRYGGTTHKLDISKSVIEITKEVLTEEEFNSLLSGVDLLEARFNEEIRIEQEAIKAENERLARERAAKQKEIQADNQFLIDVLEPMKTVSGFARDMASQLKYSELKEFSPRQVEVLADIYGKTFGRRNSEEYKKAYAEVYWKGIQVNAKTN